MRLSNSLRWLIPAPAILLAVIPQTAHADALPGLLAVGYTIDEVPPTRSDDEYPTCGNEIENNINRNFNGEPFQQCGNDLFMVHYTGYITIPENDTIEFMVAADDGGTVKVGLEEFGTWDDKGCSWSEPLQETFEAGVYTLDGWFYEHGGGTCYMLAWNIDDEGWEIVPDDAFTQTSTPVTTTTTTTSTTTTSTVPQTTTTPPETTTTTTTLPETTTTTSSTSTTTTTTTTVYVPPATTTTEPEPEPEPTTTTTEPTEEEALPPDTTLPPPEDDAPDETTPETLPEDEPDTTQPETDDPETESTPEEADPTEETEEETSESTIPDDEQPTTEELQETITAILEEQPTPQQALTLATDSQVLATITEEQAEQIFETLNLDTLDDTQIAELVAAIQNAPEEIKETFEDKVDIFKEGLDDYIPTGSNIPVGERRALIAIGAALTAAAATRIRR